MSDDIFKKTIAVLIAVVTVIATLIAFLQSDAGNRDDRAGRDANRLATELIGRRVSGEIQVNFDYDEAYQKYLEMDILSVAAANRSDTKSKERYDTVRESLRQLSPIMQPPYFNQDTGEMDYARYVVDVYLREVTRMQEHFTAASAVKDAWDTKANTYIVHLTILAVALFLLGLSTTIEIRAPRLIFTVAGVVMAAVACVWAFATYTEPVFDLRQQPDAIEAYVEGSMLAFQEQNEDAIKAFDAAIAAVPDYGSAYVARSEVHATLGNYEAAIADLQQARALGIETAFVIGNQAWFEYLLGHFPASIDIGRAALEVYPQELWIRFDLGLALLAAGEVDAARAEYQQGMNDATAAVAAARSEGKQPSSILWWSLEAAASDLENLLFMVDADEGTPPPQSIQNADQNADAIRAAVPDLITQLKSLSVSLEFYGAPPSAPLTATIENLRFAEPLYDENFNFLDYNLQDEYEYGVVEMDAVFDYSGMKDGQEVLVKVYIDGEEDASWRKVLTWDGGETGSYAIALAIAYSDTFVLGAGFYEVEIYVDGQLAASGSFVVLEPEV